MWSTWVVLTWGCREEGAEMKAVYLARKKRSHGSKGGAWALL